MAKLPLSWVEAKVSIGKLLCQTFGDKASGRSIGGRKLAESRQKTFARSAKQAE